MKRYEDPIIICSRFSEQDIITTSTDAAKAVADQLSNSGITNNIQTVVWENGVKAASVMGYAE